MVGEGGFPFSGAFDYHFFRFFSRLPFLLEKLSISEKEMKCRT